MRMEYRDEKIRSIFEKRMNTFYAQLVSVCDLISFYIQGYSTTSFSEDRITIEISGCTQSL